MSTYIDLRCDFGFKFCMQDETVMKSFLNAILDGEIDKITSVKFENVEIPRENKKQRGVTFDLLCVTEKNERILIEMQNAPQTFFKTRATYYVYQLMRKLIHRGFKWEKMKRDIPRIFGIFIMGQDDTSLTKSVTRTSVYDRDELTEFWDRNHNFYISLSKFKLDKENITAKDIWLHLFKELGNMEIIDESVYSRADEGLLRLIEKAKVAALTEDEQNLYEASMKALEDEIDMEEYGYKRGMQRGLKQGLKQGLEQGLEQGVHQESLRFAKELKEKGVAIEIIMDISHLTQEQILSL